MGNTSYYTYDTNGNVTTQLNPDGTTEVYTWQKGQKTSDTDAYGHTESYTYDSASTARFAIPRYKAFRSYRLPQLTQVSL